MKSNYNDNTVSLNPEFEWECSECTKLACFKRCRSLRVCIRSFGPNISFPFEISCILCKLRYIRLEKPIDEYPEIRLYSTYSEPILLKNDNQERLGRTSDEQLHTERTIFDCFSYLGSCVTKDGNLVGTRSTYVGRRYLLRLSDNSLKLKALVYRAAVFLVLCLRDTEFPCWRCSSFGGF